MRITPAAPDVAPRDRALVVTGAAWIAVAAALALASRPLADALFIFVVVPLLATALAGCVVLVWAAAAAGTRWAAGRPLGRAPGVLAAVLVAAAVGTAGGWDWLAERGDAVALRLRRGTYARVVADLRRGALPVRPGVDLSARGVDHVIALTAAPLRVAFLLPRGFAGDPSEWVVYDATGEVAGGAGGAAVPGPYVNSAGFRGCTPLAPGYYHCRAE